MRPIITIGDVKGIMLAHTIAGLSGVLRLLLKMINPKIIAASQVQLKKRVVVLGAQTQQRKNPAVSEVQVKRVVVLNLLQGKNNETI